MKLAFTVAEVAALRERGRELAGEARPGRRVRLIDGSRVCDGHDPEGSVFQLRQPPR